MTQLKRNKKPATIERGISPTVLGTTDIDKISHLNTMSLNGITSYYDEENWYIPIYLFKNSKGKILCKIFVWFINKLEENLKKKNPQDVFFLKIASFEPYSHITEKIDEYGNVKYIEVSKSLMIMLTLDNNDILDDLKSRDIYIKVGNGSVDSLALFDENGDEIN